LRIGRGEDLLNHLVLQVGRDTVAVLDERQITQAARGYRRPARNLAARERWIGEAVRAITAACVGGTPVVPAANDGPVPFMLATELTLARNGAIDADLSAQQPFYGTDFTKPLLFLADGQ
jgi:hypothetical protein